MAYSFSNTPKKTRIWLGIIAVGWVVAILSVTHVIP